jgi:hypothetical protein
VPFGEQDEESALVVLTTTEIRYSPAPGDGDVDVDPSTGDDWFPHEATHPRAVIPISHRAVAVPLRQRSRSRPCSILPGV